MLLYNGSQNEIVEPRFGLGEDRHDFGKGFYLTDSADLAREWSVCRPFVLRLGAGDVSMKGHPYDQSYLQDVVEIQGDLFEHLQDDAPTVDGIDFVRTYMKSATRAYLDRGEAYLATMDAKDLMAYYVTTERTAPKAGEPLVGFKPNWMGQFYARYQWESGLPSREIIEKIPPEWLAIAYYGLHDLDLPLAIEKVNAGVI